MPHSRNDNIFFSVQLLSRSLSSTSKMVSVNGLLYEEKSFDEITRISLLSIIDLLNRKIPSYFSARTHQNLLLLHYKNY